MPKGRYTSATLTKKTPIDTNRILAIIKKLRNKFSINENLMQNLMFGRMSVLDFYETYLLPLNLTKEQSAALLSPITGYATGTIQKWFTNETKNIETPVPATRILGILNTIFKLFGLHNVRITKKQ